MAARLPTWFLAEDLEGPAAIALVKAASRYDAAVGTTFRQFARQTVIGACYDAARRREYKERGHMQMEEQGHAAYDPRPSAEDLVIADQEAARTRQRVAAGMAQLPARHRLAIERIYFDGMSLEEAAPEFGVGSSRLCQIHREALGMLQELCA